MNARARFERDRAARDAARNQFDNHYQAIKSDVEERGISGRIADEMMAKAKATFDEAVAVVEERPAVVGGTLALLALWFFRAPILAWIKGILGHEADLQEESDRD